MARSPYLLVTLTAIFAAASLAPRTALGWGSTWGEKKKEFKPKAAEARPPGEKPEDLRGSMFVDNDILIGPVGGMQYSTYTDVLVDGRSTPRTNGLGFAAGAAMYWKLGWPRLEFDLLLNTRKQGERSPVTYVGLPALFKFSPVENKRISWDLGAGFQTDFAVGGGGTRRNVLVGMPLTTGLLFNVGDDVYLRTDFRYTFGLMTYDGGTTGGRPRDFDWLVGILFPIDRED